MFCPKCGSENGDEVIYCRACGIDLAAVRGALLGPGQALSSSSVYLTPRQVRRLRRRGLNGTEAPLTIAERAIDLQSSGIRGLFLGGGFALITYLVYQNPPVGGIFWLLPLAFTFLFFSATLSRFIQAGMIKKLIRTGQQPPALTDAKQDYIQPPRSIYETDELAQPRSITDATTRHLR